MHGGGLLRPQSYLVADRGRQSQFLGSVATGRLSVIQWVAPYLRTYTRIRGANGLGGLFLRTRRGYLLSCAQKGNKRSHVPVPGP